METLVQLVLSGILLGGVYALAALGLNLIFGVAKVINFAHGEFLMLGMYAGFWLMTLTGVNPYFGAPLIGAGFFALGALFMDLIPAAIDKAVASDCVHFSRNYFIVSFLLFINIHHFFIDSAFWRRDNKDVQQFLFRA